METGVANGACYVCRMGSTVLRRASDAFVPVRDGAVAGYIEGRAALHGIYPGDAHGLYVYSVL